MKSPSLASQSECTGCLACVDVCPKSALHRTVGSDGHIYVSLDTNSCVGCGKCERLCNDIHQTKYGSTVKSSKPYSVFNNDVKDYKLATSGGIFPAVARWILRQNGVVYGTAYCNDGIHAEVIRIDEEKHIKLLQGSKYQQSNTKGVYTRIKSDLNAQKMVLFSGTGCQVAGVLAYFRNHPLKENLFTIDIVCGGVPTSLLIEKFSQEAKPELKRLLSYREKERYVMSYISTDDKIISQSKNLPLSGFKSGITNRYSCYNCKFVGLHRASDMTIGDYWGDKHSDGTARSICICHSDRAKELMEDLDVTKEDIDWSFVLSNPRVVDGRCPFESRIERKYLSFFFTHLSYKNLCKLYAYNIRKYDILWMVYNIYRFIRFKIYKNNSIKRAKKAID